MLALGNVRRKTDPSSSKYSATDSDTYQEAVTNEAEAKIAHAQAKAVPDEAGQPWLPAIPTEPTSQQPAGMQKAECRPCDT